MKFHAWFAQELDAGPTTVRRLDDGHELHLPNLSPEQLSAIAQRVLRARTTLLATPVDVIVDAIDRAAAILADPASDLGKIARTLIPLTTGYSPPMVNHVLERMTRDWRRPALEQLLRNELGDPAVLDHFSESVPRRRRWAVGAALTAHIFSGNVPGVAVTSLVRALLVKSPSIGKTARAEPILPALFAHALERVSPAIASALAVLYFEGGSQPLEDALLESAELLVIYGGADVVEQLAPCAPGRVVIHGPRLSLGVVHDRAAEEPEVIRAAARAVATFDQQGCVSPHMIFVLTTDLEHARTFARALSAAFDAVDAELPRGSLSAPEAVAMRNARTQAEFRSEDGHDVELHTSTSATVVFESAAAFQASCLNRFVYVAPVESEAALIDLLQPHGELLQSVALEGFEQKEAAGLAMQLGSIGVTRITSLDQLPWPPVDWHHDGASPLGELIRWVDWES